MQHKRFLLSRHRLDLLLDAVSSGISLAVITVALGVSATICWLESSPLGIGLFWMFGDSIRPSAISVCATGFVGKQGFGRVREWLGVLWGTELWWLIFTRTPPPSWTLHLPGSLLSFTHIRPLPLFSHSCCVEVQQPGYTYTCFISPRTPPWPLPAPRILYSHSL